MVKRIVLGILILLALSGIGYSIRQTASPNQGLRIATSTYPLYFFASQITGDLANIRTITPAGAEPHEYEPSGKDIAWIEQSSILILNGGNLEPWGDSIQTDLKHTNVSIVVTGNNLISRQKDPHIWLSPVLAQTMVKSIATAIKIKDPTHAAIYTQHEQTLLKRLQQLDTDYSVKLQHCQTKDIVTSHEAFGYLADQYNLNQIAISGLSPEAEPSPQKMAEITRYIKEQGIHHVFFERIVSPKLAETIAHETGATTLVLDPIEGISDHEKETGKNYFTQMEDNLHNLRIALSCQ